MARTAKEPKNLPPSTQRFLEIINENGISRSELAQRFGMTIDGINKIFNRGSEISVVQAKAIELEFGISQQWILNGESPQRREHGVNDLQQLLLRLVPNYSPELTWQCFEELLDNEWYGRERLGGDPTGFEYKRYASSLKKLTGNNEWLEKFYALQQTLIEKLQEMKTHYIEIAKESSIGGYDQTLILRILLDGIELTDEMLSEEKMLYSKQLLSPEKIQLYLKKLKRFSKQRRQLNNLMEAPLELKRKYVEKTNDIRRREELRVIDSRISGELIVQIDPFLRINEQEQVVEDRVRQQIFHQRIAIATQQLLMAKAKPQKKEQINMKISQMQNELHRLLQQWKQEKEDGATS